MYSYKNTKSHVKWVNHDMSRDDVSYDLSSFLIQRIQNSGPAQKLKGV